jgi:putative endonuclease
MPLDHHYHVSILSSRSRAIYIGVTSDLVQRIACHRSKAIPSHTNRYRITRLVYFEGTTDISAAIARENSSRGGGGRKRFG